MKAKAILFDMGNTIFSEREYYPELGIKKLIEMSNNCEKISYEDIAKVYYEIEKETFLRSTNSLIEFTFHNFVKVLFSHFGLELSRSLYEIELEFWKSAYRFVKLEPGVLKVLKDIKSMEIPIGVVSNSFIGSNTLMFEFEKHHIREYFDVIVSSADYGILKPHPLLFKVAARKVNCKLEEILFIGDSYKSDVCGALNVGMKAIWYNKYKRNIDEVQPCEQIYCWDDFDSSLHL